MSRIASAGSRRAKLEMRFTTSIAPLNRAWRRVVEQALRRSCGYSLSLMWPLVALFRFGDGKRHGDLAELVGVEAPSLVRQLATLESLGLIMRRDDKEDKRVKTVHLTGTGRALARENEELLKRLRRELLGNLSDRELEATCGVLQAFDAALTRFESNPQPVLSAVLAKS